MEYLSKGLMPAGRPLTLNLLRLSGTMDKFHLQNLELAECRNIMALDFGKLMTGPKEISILLDKLASSFLLLTLRSLDLSKQNLTKVSPQSLKKVLTSTAELKIFIISQCTMGNAQIQGILGGLQETHHLGLKIFRANYVVHQDPKKRGLTDPLLARIIKALGKAPLVELSIAQSGAVQQAGMAISNLVQFSSKLAILDISQNLIPQRILNKEFTIAVNSNISLGKLYMSNMKNVASSGCPCCPTVAEFVIQLGNALPNKVQKNHATRRKIDILTNSLMDDVQNAVVDTWEGVYRHVESTVSQDFFTCFRKCAKFKRQCYIDNKNAQNFMEALSLHWMAQSAAHPPSISYVINQFPQHQMQPSLPPPQMQSQPLALGMQQGGQPELPVNNSILNQSQDQLLLNESQYGAAMAAVPSDQPIPLGPQQEEKKEEEKEPHKEPSLDEQPEENLKSKLKKMAKDQMFKQHQGAVLASLQEAQGENGSEIIEPTKNIPAHEIIEEEAQKAEGPDIKAKAQNSQEIEEEAKKVQQIKSEEVRAEKDQIQDSKVVEEELKELEVQESKQAQEDISKEEEKKEIGSEQLIAEELQKVHNEEDATLPSPFDFNTTASPDLILQEQKKKGKEEITQNSSKKLIDYINSLIIFSLSSLEHSLHCLSKYLSSLINQ